MSPADNYQRPVEKRYNTNTEEKRSSNLYSIWVFAVVSFLIGAADVFGGKKLLCIRLLRIGVLGKQVQYMAERQNNF